LVRVLSLDLLQILLKTEQLWNERCLYDKFSLIEEVNDGFVVLYRFAILLFLSRKDQILFVHLDLQEGVIRLLDLRQNDRVQCMSQLVVNLEFLYPNSQLRLAHEVRFPFFLFHLAESVLVDPLHALHVDEHDLFDPQGAGVDDGEVEVLH